MREKITNTFLQKSKQRTDKPLFIYDTSLIGFGVKITKMKKTYFAEGRVKGKRNKTRTSLGTYPALTVHQARILAKDALSKMAQGINPNAEKRKLELEQVTLGEAFADYLQVKTLKPRTVRDYHENMRNAFSDWENKPILSINKKMIRKRHSDLGERSHARADNAMRMLRAIFNFSIHQYEDENGHTLVPVNPVSTLTHMKLWYNVGRKQTVVHKSELKRLFDAVLSLKDTSSSSKAEVVRDYLIFLLFTGLRRTEAATLKWENVDFNNRSFKVLETKNGKVHELPLPDYIIEMLTKRKKSNDSEYVFPGKSQNGHIVEPKRWIKYVSEKSGVKFTLHDLRRTFATIAESLNISSYSLKLLLNHSTSNLDVTSGYLILDTERLREPMQLIAECILKNAGVNN